MCRKLPQTNEEFLNVSGVGNAKMEKYGDKFTGLIRAYLSEHPDVQKREGSFQREGSVQTQGGLSYREQVINRGLDSAYNPWTSEEDAQLAEEFEKGLSIKDISGIHKRTLRYDELSSHWVSQHCCFPNRRLIRQSRYFQVDIIIIWPI